MLQYSLTGVVYLLCLRKDIQEKRISRKIISMYLLLALAGLGIKHLYMDEGLMEKGIGLLKEMSIAFIPGAVALCLSWVTREAIGYGDSCLILGCGFSLGIEKCMELILWAFFFSALWSLGLLVICRADRRREIPFVPFLLLGWIMLLPQMTAAVF